MRLENRPLERIALEFPAPEQAAVVELLGGYAGVERERVIWDILELSKGSLENLRKYLLVAEADYRDVIYWAEYYSTDPMLQGRDLEKLVKDLLTKWGPPK